MSWERFWDHVKEANYREAKADLRDYDTVFDACPTISELPTSDLLTLLESHCDSIEYSARLRAEILKRCIDPPLFTPKMAKNEYVSSRRKMVAALFAIEKLNSMFMTDDVLASRGHQHTA